MWLLTVILTAPLEAALAATCGTPACSPNSPVAGCVPTTKAVTVDSNGNQLGSAGISLSGDANFLVWIGFPPSGSAQQILIGATSF